MERLALGPDDARINRGRRPPASTLASRGAWVRRGSAGARLEHGWQKLPYTVLCKEPEGVRTARSAVCTPGQRSMGFRTLKISQEEAWC